MVIMNEHDIKIDDVTTFSDLESRGFARQFYNNNFIVTRNPKRTFFSAYNHVCQPDLLRNYTIYR